MGKSRAAAARHLVVGLHVVSSVGWMSQAVALLALVGASAAAEPGPTKEMAAWAASYLDAGVLVFFANTSAFTGLLLSATTPWGYVRHWWVAVKLVLTIGQLYAGIFLLSGALHETVTSAAAGVDGPAVAVAVGAGVMASGLAFQTWISVAKPWGRTPLARRGERGRTAPTWLFVLAPVAAVVDVASGMVLGRPLPVASIVVLVVALGVRAWSVPALRQSVGASASSSP